MYNSPENERRPDEDEQFKFSLIESPRKQDNSIVNSPERSRNLLKEVKNIKKKYNQLESELNNKEDEISTLKRVNTH